MADIRRPADANDVAGRDLGAPAQEFLRGLGLLSSVDKVQSQMDSGDIVVSNMLAVTKASNGVSKAITAAGGVGAIVTSIAATVRDIDPLVVSAAFISTAIVMAAGVAGMARITDGDVRTRGSVTTAAMEARGSVTTALLESFDKVALAPQPASPAESKPAIVAASTNPPGQGLSGPELRLLLAVACYPGRLTVNTPTGDGLVTGIRWAPGTGFLVRVEGGDLVKSEDVTSFTTN